MTRMSLSISRVIDLPTRGAVRRSRAAARVSSKSGIGQLISVAVTVGVVSEDVEARSAHGEWLRIPLRHPYVAAHGGDFEAFDAGAEDVRLGRLIGFFWGHHDDV